MSTRPKLGSKQAHHVIHYPWSWSVRWCLAEGLACGDQRRRTGNSSALDACSQLYKSTFTLLYCILLLVTKLLSLSDCQLGYSQTLVSNMEFFHSALVALFIASVRVTPSEFRHDVSFTETGGTWLEVWWHAELFCHCQRVWQSNRENCHRIYRVCRDSLP